MISAIRRLGRRADRLGHDSLIVIEKLDAMASKLADIENAMRGEDAGGVSDVLDLGLSSSSMIIASKIKANLALSCGRK